jgi:hypothetical protein
MPELNTLLFMVEFFLPGNTLPAGHLRCAFRYLSSEQFSGGRLQVRADMTSFYGRFVGVRRTYEPASTSRWLNVRQAKHSAFSTLATIPTIRDNVARSGPSSQHYYLLWTYLLPSTLTDTTGSGEYVVGRPAVGGLATGGGAGCGAAHFLGGVRERKAGARCNTNVLCDRSRRCETVVVPVGCCLCSR